MFSGAYEHNVDDKCRTVIPVRFRQRLGDNFVITRGLHGCLWVFPEAKWREIQQGLTPKSLLDIQGIKLERYFLGAASHITPDKQGRIAIPQMLIEHACITPGCNIWIVGLTDKLEIWEKHKWDDFNTELSNDILADQHNNV